MDEQTLKNKMYTVQHELEAEIKGLADRRVLNDGDIQRMKTQLRVSADAILSSNSKNYYAAQIQDELIDDLVADYRNSIYQLLYKAVARQGQRALFEFRVGLHQKQQLSEIAQHRSIGNISQEEEALKVGFIEGVRRTCLSMIPESQGFLASKSNVEDMLNLYLQLTNNYIGHPQSRMIRSR